MIKDQGIEPNHRQAFTSLDSDGDKKISHQEYMLVQGSDLFSRRDKDASGSVSLKEYIAFESPLKESTELEGIFEELDIDKDGKLSRVEARGLHHDANSEKNDADQKSHEFKAIDHDSSGGIDYGEWVDFHTIHTHSNVQKDDIDATFDRFDFDGDGTVTEDEFTRPVSSPSPDRDDI